MTFKPAVWYPIAATLAVINWIGLGWAVREPTEPLHAAIHGVLALAFGFWARRLRQLPPGSDTTPRLEARDSGSDNQSRLEALGDEVNSLRQELGETQERLDFAERLLAQRREPGRSDPQR